jgi:hypothetical protein
MERSSENQGELSLIEMIENLKKSDGRRTPDPSSSASIAIALNEEQNRRQVYYGFDKYNLLPPFIFSFQTGV